MRELEYRKKGVLELQTHGAF